ncbi:MAG: hypothetical protein SOZ30_08320, partial [Roseburia lenta]|nr:hypothetical protein [Roseburia lenta]
HFFVIISKDVLKYIAHKIIMEDKEQENNPYPSRLRGRGVEVSKTLFYADINYLISLKNILAFY